jgi:hypothetical protein
VLLAGGAGVLASLSSNVKMLRFTVPSLAIAGSALAILSPLYVLLHHLPSLNIQFKPEVGAIAALFTGVAMAGGGFISAMIGFVVLRPSSGPSASPAIAYAPVQTPAYEVQQEFAQGYEEPSLSREEEVFEELLRQEEVGIGTANPTRTGAGTFALSDGRTAAKAPGSNTGVCHLRRNDPRRLAQVLQLLRCSDAQGVRRDLARHRRQVPELRRSLQLTPPSKGPLTAAPVRASLLERTFRKSVK